MRILDPCHIADLEFVPPLTHYVITRSDLPVGFLAAQIVHAAGESSPGSLSHGTNAVVLAVPNEAALVAIAARFKALGVPHVPIHEPDAPWNGAMTAIGVQPVADRALVRKVVSSLPLLGGSSHGCRCCGTLRLRPQAHGMEPRAGAPVPT